MGVRVSALPAAVPRQHYVTLQGQRFRYLHWGHSGATIVLVHGTGFHAYVWKPIAEDLGRESQVIAPDQRGHGDSVKPESGYAWEVFAADLYAFLMALGCMAVDAIGHSGGATAIARCAAQHPGTIRRAVLIDPILFPKPGAGGVIDNPLAHRARKRRMVWESRTSMFLSYRNRPPFNTWRQEVLWAYIEEGTFLRSDGHVELKCPGAIEAQIFEQAPTSDGFSILPHVGIPVLLLRGAASDAFPAASAEQALALLPDARLAVVPETTHFAPMEKPEAVAQAAREFFGV